MSAGRIVVVVVTGAEETRRFADDMVRSRGEHTWGVQGHLTWCEESGFWAGKHENEWSPDKSEMAGQVLVPS
jgi:hypothetical protein